MKININFKFLLKLIIALGILIVFSFYFFHQSRAFLLGPQIIIKYPKNGQTLNNSILSMKGIVFNTSNLFIDGQAVLSDERGNFEKNLILAKGYNIIEILAEDRHNRVVNKKLELVLK